MRKAISLFVLGTLVASCSSDPGAPKVLNGAREAFEDWVRACVDGDSNKVFRGMSDGYKSGWLFDRFAHTSPIGLISGLLIGVVVSIFGAVTSAMRTSANAAATGPVPPPAPRDEDDEA